MRQRLIPAMLAVAIGAMPLHAVSEYERDAHVETIIALVDQGMRLPAERSIRLFRTKDYPDTQRFYHGLRLYFTDVFRVHTHVPTATAMEQEHQRLAAEFAAADNLPASLKPLVVRDKKAEVQRFASAILKTFNPDAPPPLVALVPEKQAHIRLQIQRLLASADAALATAMAAVDAHEPALQRGWNLPAGQPQQVAVFQQAALLRAEYATVFYHAYRALRAVCDRGHEFGMPSDVVANVVEPWLHQTLQAHMQALQNWEWNFDFYPLLQHRLAVMFAEAVRLNAQRPDLPAIAQVDANAVKDSFFRVIDLPIDGFERQFRDGFRALQLEAWGDLLQWHLMLGDDQAVQAGLALWEDAHTRALPLRDPVLTLQAAAGHVYILAARLFTVSGQHDQARQVLTQLKNADSFFSGNAGLWLRHGPDQGDPPPWNTQPIAANPESMLAMARALQQTASRTADGHIAQKMKQNALVALRNGVLGLPAVDDPDFAQWAPRIYQRYTYALYDEGRRYAATAIAQEGLRRLVPLWQRHTGAGGNPWLHDGELSAAGKVTQQLAYDFYAHAAGLRRRDPSAAVDELYRDAIGLLKIVAPDRANEDLRRREILLAIGRMDYAEALELLVAFTAENTDQPITSAYLRATITYQQLRQALKQQPADGKVSAITAAHEDTLAQRQHTFNAALAQLRSIIIPITGDEHSLAPEQRTDYERARRFLTVAEVAVAFESEQYHSVLRLLDHEFWAQKQDDPNLTRQLLQYLVAAAYKCNLTIARDPQQREDPAQLLALWPHYLHAHSVYLQVMRESPPQAGTHTSLRKQLSQVMNVSARQARWFAQQVHAANPEFSAYSVAEFATIAAQAQSRFADIYPIDAATAPRIVLAVAQAYWDTDRPQAAVPLFERYKAHLADQPLHQAFRQDPDALINRWREIFTVRSSLDVFWQRTGAQSISDALLDHPRLAQELANPLLTANDWSERPRNYALASVQVGAFATALEAQQALIPNYATLQRELNALREFVTELQHELAVNTQLAQAYQQAGRHTEAMALAQQLIAYDPLNRTAMRLLVDGALHAITEAYPLSRDEAQQVRSIAARLRDHAKRLPQQRALYWTAAIQVLEISLYLQDLDVVNTTLQRQRVDRNVPPIDLSIHGSQPLRAQDAASLAIAQRYLALFAHDGITVPAPFRIEQNGEHTEFHWLP